MDLRIQQANLNHARYAQDLLLQGMVQYKIGIALLSEPYSVSQHENWTGDLDGVAAICRNPREYSGTMKILDKGKGYVVVKLKSKTLYSCYIFPNISIEDFEPFFRKLSASLVAYSKNHTIVAGDFNAKSKLWGSRVDDRRGELLLDWIAQHNLTVVNEGMISTCVREQGKSVVDITLCTKDLVDKIRDWKVLENVEILSDHRYIVMHVSKGKDEPRRRK